MTAVNNENITDKEKMLIKPPSKYQVIFFNDDFTSFEFVSFILVNFFGKTEEQAMAFASKVHNEGSAVAGVYSREIAETKAEIVRLNAQNNDYPLKVTIEKED